MLVPISVERGARQVQAVALPGLGSKALGPCRLEEIDLDVPIRGGGRVSLVRRFNSFFQLNGPWGKGWTADWPHLDEVKLPLERTDKAVKFKLLYELRTPLGRIDARFSETRHVPQLNAKLLVPDSNCEVLALAAANDPIVKQGKTEIVFKDGRTWFFDDKGNFAGEQSKPFTIVYLRNSADKVEQIIGYEGDQPRAAVRLAYDDQGRLKRAESDDPGERITYQYDSDGYLESVSSAHGKTSYTYDRGLVKTISWSAGIDGELFEDPVLQREFNYAPNGQLLADWADGIKTSYTFQMENGRHRMAITPEDGSNGTVAVYDERLRPVEVTESDNTRTQWAYAADGGIKTETTVPNGEVIRTSLSADGKHRLVETSDNVLVREDCDEGGRLTNLEVNQRPVLQQEWHSNGLLKSVSCETHSVIPQYDKDGRLRSTLQVKPSEGDKFSLWQETQYDEAGRVQAVKDHTGSDVEVRYDSTGNVAALMAKRDGKDFGFDIRRNTAGQIEHINSSWGQEERRYDASGGIEEVLVKTGPATAKADFSRRRITSVTQFDGGRVQFDYHTDGKAEGSLKSVQTPAVTLNYHYGPEGALAEVDLGEACRTTYEHDAQGEVVRLAMEPRPE
jgi:YD repeat-containing protein